MTPVRVAILGAGGFVRRQHIPNIMDLADHFQVSCIYSRTEASARAARDLIGPQVAISTNLEATLSRDDIDAVLVCLPIFMLPDIAEKALAAGKHVLSEKPLAPSVARGEQALESYETYRQRGLVWHVAENWRHAPAMQRAAEALQKGDIGQPALASWAIYAGVSPQSPAYQSAWRKDDSHAGGFLLDGGVHFAAALRLLFGEVASAMVHLSHQRDDLPAPDTLTATLAFEGGLHATLAVTYAVGLPWVTKMIIAGEKGVITVNRDVYELQIDGVVQDQLEGAGNGIREEWLAFAEAIAAGAPSNQNLNNALGDLRLIETLLTAHH